MPMTKPPLPHAATMEAPTRPRRGERPPLRRSIRLEDDDGAAEERRRVFVQASHQMSFDECDATDDDDDHDTVCECARSSFERSRGTSIETPEEEEELAVSPPTPLPPIAYPYRHHLRGVSSDRALADRRDGSPANKAPARALSQGIFERRLPKMYKFGFMDKSKRASSSALYDNGERERSPTEAFYNATGSTRLSSQELFEKFCSEDFTSLYGKEDTRRRRTPHSKSTGSSGSDVRHERTCCRRTPCHSQPTLGRRHMCRTLRSERSTDSEEQTSPNRRPPLTSSNAIHNPSTFEYDEEDGQDDYARSAPLLSPDRFEARFTFDISEHSEAPSVKDETPSDATETRNLTLYEEPYSDHTSICELFDMAFSSQQTSFKRNGSRRNRGPVDLSTLDFRAIDDDTPDVSRQHSFRSKCEGDDTLCHTSENRSWASDSVFATPEKRVRCGSVSSADTKKQIIVTNESIHTGSVAADSTIADTTIVEDDPKSVIERTEYAVAIDTGCIELETVFDGNDRSVESPLDHGPTLMSSRPSMHKLEILEPTKTSAAADENSSKNRRRRGTSEPRRFSRCFPL